MSLHGEEGQQGKQGFTFKPQDKKVAICEPSVQKALVGSWEALCETAPVNKSFKDNREKWT